MVKLHYQDSDLLEGGGSEQESVTLTWQIRLMIHDDA